MKIAAPPEAYGYTIFCDDIRSETGNKLSFMGIYTGQMLVQGVLPALLPKLALSMVYRQRYDKVVLPVQFQIFFPWDQENPMLVNPPTEHVQPAIEGAKLLSQRADEVAYASVSYQFSFVPFVINAPGIMRVRAVRGDELIRLGGMEIVAVPPPDGSAAPTIAPQG